MYIYTYTDILSPLLLCLYLFFRLNLTKNHYKFFFPIKEMRYRFLILFVNNLQTIKGSSPDSRI